MIGATKEKTKTKGKRTRKDLDDEQLARLLQYEEWYGQADLDDDEKPGDHSIETPDSEEDEPGSSEPEGKKKKVEPRKIYQPFALTLPEGEVIPEDEVKEGKQEEDAPKKKKAVKKKKAPKKEAKKSSDSFERDPILDGALEVTHPCEALFESTEFLQMIEEDDVEFHPKKEPPKITEDIITLRVCTWNMEKFCEGSLKLEQKIQILLKILDIYHPDFLVIQEVTDAALLEKMTLGAPVIETDTHYYPLSKEYKMCQGPRFHAATYSEHYVMFYNTATVLGDPELKLLSAGGTKLRDATPNQSIKFSTEERKPRPMVTWRCQVPLFRINRDIVQEVIVGAVHTSPSYVNQQATKFVISATNIRDQEDIPMILSGDWYIQNGAKTLWGQLANGVDNWILVAPQKLTNFKELPSGDIGGQTADHHIVSTHFHATDYQPLTISSLPMHSLGEHDEKKHTNEQLSKLLDIDVDHAPVLATLELKYPREEDKEEDSGEEG